MSAEFFSLVVLLVRCRLHDLCDDTELLESHEDTAIESILFIVLNKNSFVDRILSLSKKYKCIPL